MRTKILDFQYPVNAVALSKEPYRHSRWQSGANCFSAPEKHHLFVTIGEIRRATDARESERSNVQSFSRLISVCVHTARVSRAPHLWLRINKRDNSFQPLGALAEGG